MESHPDTCQGIDRNTEDSLDHTLGASRNKPGFSMSEIDQNCHLRERGRLSVEH